jgi:hypothetical protein
VAKAAKATANFGLWCEFIKSQVRLVAVRRLCYFRKILVGKRPMDKKGFSKD